MNQPQTPPVQSTRHILTEALKPTLLMTENEGLLRFFSIGLSLWDFILCPKVFPIRQPFKHCKNHWGNPGGTPCTTSFRCLKEPGLAWSPIFTLPWKDGWGHSKTSIVQSLCHLSNYFISLATVWKRNPTATMDLSFVLYHSGLQSCCFLTQILPYCSAYHSHGLSQRSLF